MLFNVKKFYKTQEKRGITWEGMGGPKPLGGSIEPTIGGWWGTFRVKNLKKKIKEN